MKTWLKRIAAGLAAVIILFVGGVCLASVLRLQKTYDTALVDFDAAGFHFAPGVAEQ